MASGKKNYFRHSFNAFEDEKIQNAIALLGYEGYAYYFILIELLAKKCDAEFKNPIRIHQQSLRNVWRKQSKSCNKVVKKLQESGLFVATFSESFIEFDIPNLSKYMGKYTIKKSPNTPNKKKRKEKKRKESKKGVFDFNLIYDAYPKKQGKKNGIEKLEKIITTQLMFDEVLEGSKKYKKHCLNKSIEKQYIKQFSTWVNGAHWNDEYDNGECEFEKWALENMYSTPIGR